MIDYQMPMMTGDQAIQIIMSLLEQRKDDEVPERPVINPYIVCMLSICGDHDKVKQVCNSAGIDELVSKPIFKSCIHRLLAKV